MFQTPSLRLALGLGDQELEQRLRPAFDTSEDTQVVAQCLAADQVVQAVESGEVDGVVVAWTLHRLTEAVLDQLERSRVPIVLLVVDPAAERWQGRHGPVLGLDSDVDAIRQALFAARQGARVAHNKRLRDDTEPVVLKPVDRVNVAEAGRPVGRIIAVTSGQGSPGTTTVALNLATALGGAAPTVLVDMDLESPALAAYLDRDPSRNVCTLAHAVREDPHVWGSALADELQPLCADSRSGVVLCGLPKREMRTTIGPPFVDRLVAELSHRYRYVVLDVGAELLGMDTSAANHRAALAAAQQVLVVSRSDLVGLWHTRTALDQLERQLGIERAKVGLVLNRHDARHHHSRQEIQWHLGTPVVALLQTDTAAAERATAAQRPLVVDQASRAGRALLALADHIHDGRPATLRLQVKSGSDVNRSHWWQRLVERKSRAVPMRPLPIESAPERVGVEREARGRVAW